MVNTNKIRFKKLRDKVYVKHLARDKKRDFQFDIIKLALNTVYPKHRHEDFEWIYVLKGTFTDEFGFFKEGDFKVNPKNSTHSIKTDDNGCELPIC